MADSFRISSGDGKVPELSTSRKEGQLTKQIQNMDPSTAYVVVRGVVIPALNRLQENFSHLSQGSPNLQSPMALSASKKTDFTAVRKELEAIKSEFNKVQGQILDLQKNADLIKSLLVDKSKDPNTKLEGNEYWTVDYSKHTNPDPEVRKDAHGGPFGDFFVFTIRIRSALKKLQARLEKLKSAFSDNSALKKLSEAVKSLLNNIPSASSKWDNGTYDGKFWTSLRYQVTWDDSNENAPENPTGFLDMVQDSEKLAKYMKFITDGFTALKMLSSRDIYFKELYQLPTEEAYMFMILTLLPMLQTQSAEQLEQQGNTMKEISKIYDKWNDIQDTINRAEKRAKEILSWGFKPGSTANVLTGDKKKKFLEFFTLRDNIIDKANEVQNSLKSLLGKLPPSTKTLIDTMDQLCDKVKTEFPPPSSKWNDTNNTYDGIKWEVDIDGNTTEVSWNDRGHAILPDKNSTNPTGFLDIALDSDQTKFKSYMDNLAQGITALTSISNMAQQEVQIATQYHNSLLGLEKSAMDSLNKVSQIATKPPGH